MTFFAIKYHHFKLEFLININFLLQDLLICEMLDVHDTVGGQNWTWFTKDVVYRDETFVVFEG